MVFWEGSLHLEDEVPKCILLLPKNTEMFIPLFFVRTPFFLRMDCGLSSFFLRMEVAQEGPKKGGCIPLFYFFYGLRLQGSFKTFWGPTGPSRPDLPLWPGPSLNTSSRTRFGPDLDLKSPFSGPNQVPGEVFSEGPGQRGRSGRDGPVGPPKKSWT